MSVRFKPVPAPPADREALATAQRAVPLVPRGENDCCTRIGRRVGLAGRDAARTWLTFLRALGLVERTDRGFARTDRDPSGEATRTAFRERVFGAREVLAAVADGPTTVEEAFAAVAPAVPTWERERRGDWEAVWRERTRNLLGWAVVLGLAVETDRGYRTA